ncbi:MAG: hypothetical protein M0R76_06605 [Proteobacteria bacterium]|nr:hypothetical protein [Pseudomonadota bacterium]
MTRTKQWMLSFCLVGLMAAVAVAFSGCDSDDDASDASADANADSGSDSNATNNGGDSSGNNGKDAFPGNCECAARFTLDGKQVNICEKSFYNCACLLTDSETLLSCRFFLQDNRLTYIAIDNMDTSLVAPGQEYASFDYYLSSMILKADDTSYAGGFYHVFFQQYQGAGGTASGTFTATVSDPDGTQNWFITDGQFHAPIVVHEP